MRRLRTFLFFLPAVFLALALSAAAGAATFTPTDDSYVNAASPTQNYGSSTSLRPDATPERNAYLRFDVTGTSGDPTATLRFYAVNNHSVGLDLRTVSSTSWSESTITCNNAPAFGPIIGSTGPLSAGNWYLLDVSDEVVGNGPISFALTTTGSSSAKIISGEGVEAPELIVPALPSPSPFLVSKINATTYEAESQTTTDMFTGSLKSVVQSAVLLMDQTGGGTLTFTADDFDLGSDHFEFDEVADIIFEGQGIDVTTIGNDSSASTDTEPFDFVGADRVTIRDLTVDADGPQRTTSDVIDFDLGNDVVIERVKVSDSRGRGIVFDGKEQGRSADRNTVRDCVIDGIPGDGIELLASRNNLIEGCTITNVGGHGIQITKSSPFADDPNKKSNDNEIRDNTIDQAGKDGINLISSDDNLLIDNLITNSADDTSNRDGIRVTSTHSITCDDNIVQGNTATDNQATKTQRYGLSISNALCNRTVVDGNDFTGNRVGEINDLGTDTQITHEPGEPFNPVADAYVNSSKPTTNYGSSTVLRTDASPVIRSYLRFSVTGLVEPPSQTTLRIYAETGNSVGFDVHDVTDDSWGELAISYANSPPVGSYVGSSGAFSAGVYVEVDVTSLVTGNGLISLALTSPSSTAVRYASRQSSNPPELVIVEGSPPAAAPVSVPTSSSTPPSGSPAVLSASAAPPRQTAALQPLAIPPRVTHRRVDAPR